MYNTDFPERADLPTTQRLVRSTIIAGVAAIAILITVVLPAEYGVDPTRIGRVLGLTEMGEIKMQLAEEAAAEEALSAAVAAGQPVPQAGTPGVDVSQLQSRLDVLEQIVMGLQAGAITSGAPEPGSEQAPVQQQAATTTEPQVLEPKVASATPQWRDEIVFTLTPGEGTEYKLVMESGAIATYEFIVDGGVINFDAHGDGGGQSVAFEEGRGVPGDSGELQAPFAGNHGWFFRNRGSEDVVVTLRTGGQYQELRKLI